MPSVPADAVYSVGVDARRPIIALLTGGDEPLPHNLAAIEECADVRVCRADTLADALVGADIVMVWDFFSAALKDSWGPSTAELRWVHVCATGVDSLLFDGLRQSRVVLTNAAGVFDRPIAEFVLASILAHDKRIHESKSFQREHLWRHRETLRTCDNNVLVIGTGGIGRAIARLLQAVGMAVSGAGRTARTEDPDFGVVYPSDDLAAYVGDADVVIAVAPLTPQTEQMIDAEVLAAMRPSAHFINVGRGQLVDEQALVDALSSGSIGAASLDVFATEPLPVDHPLWEMSNVCISPHMSGDAVGWREELADRFLDNLRRYVAAGGADATPAELTGALVTVVDKLKGYSARP